MYMYIYLLAHVCMWWQIKKKKMPCNLFRDKEQYVGRFDKKRVEKWNNFIVSIREK